MSLFDVVLLSVLATALLLIAVFFLVKGVRAVWSLVRDLNANLQQAKLSLHSLILLLQTVRDELAYMRSITQAASPNFGQEPPQPPLGRAGTMPGGAPQFPTPVWDHFHAVAPDALQEDTDTGLLEQTDRELIEAQNLETLREHGIEPDENDDRPIEAVVDEA